MKKEIKNILGLLVLVLPLFGLIVFGWLCSPMYADVKADQRLNAQKYLAETYFYRSIPEISLLRGQLIEKYNFTEDELNPSWVLDNFLPQKPYNQNLGGLE